jgi:hypothetical protein
VAGAQRPCRGIVREGDLADTLAPFLEDRAALDRLLQDLETCGWVARVERGLTLTIDGERAHRDATAAVNVIRERVSNGIGAEDYNRTMNVLRTMTANLQHARHR